MNASKLEKLAVHISSLKSRVKCPICNEPAERGVQLECKHRFCSNCISQITEKKPSVCTLCKSPIKRRAPLYKDQVADSLGTFVNIACQIIKEKYAHSVESLSSGKLNLERVIEVAPPDFINPNLLTKKNFDVCGSSSIQTDSTTDTKSKELRIALSCKNEAVKHKIVDWLNKNSGKFDKRSPSPIGEETANFQMPSISQVALAEKKGARTRSQSLTECDNLPEPLVKRYKSLTEGLNSEEIDDYSIEEVLPETVIKQVEKTQVKQTPPKKRKRSSEKNKSLSDLGSSSDWNRLKKVKNTLEKAAKTPKQLKIKLQSPGTKPKSDSKNESNTEPLKKSETTETVNEDHLNNVLNEIWIEPFQNNSKDLNSVAVQLFEKLKLCQSNTEKLPKEYRQIQECFTNLLTYANEIIQLNNEKHCFESVATQTEILEQFDVGIQTESKTEPKQDKNIQTLSSQYQNVLVQTDALEEIVSSETLQSKKTVSEVVNKQKSSSRISSQSKTSQTSKTSQPAHISVDESKDKSSKTNISEGSELLITLGSSSKSTRKKIKRKLVYDEPKSDRKFKRIKTFSSDSEPEDGLPKKRKLVQEDFTVEFLDSENVLSSATPESEKIDYDQYLLDVMSKYDPGPSTSTKKTGPVKKTKKVEAVQKQRIQISNSLNDDHVFTNCTALENLDLEIMEQHLPKSLNTELELVEPTPVEPAKISKFKLSNKKSSLESKESEKIISKGAAPSVKHPELLESNNFDKTSTLNRNLPLQTQTNELPNDLADMIKDLENRKDIFLDDFESQAIKISKNIPNKASCEFEDDQELENEMKKISFPASEQVLNENKINILQDIVIRPDDVELVESDASDCDVVDSTPQKVKPNFADRSILRDLDEEQNLTSQDLVLCLPPPPGFADVDLVENHKENQPPAAATFQRLTDFLVSPENKLTQSEKLVSQTNKMHRASEIIIEDTEEVFSPVAKSSLRPSQCKYTPLLSSSRSAKKTTILTSTPTQKSILNFVVPSQHSTTLKKPCIMWSRIINKDLNVFTQLECKKLLTTAKFFNDQVTHLIVLVDERGRIVSHTAKTLQAIAAGIWVVRYEWVEDCLRMNRIVAEEPYEVLDSTGQPGPQISRLNRKSNPLFKGFRFLCAPPLRSVPKSDLENIIRLAGGDVTNDISDFLSRDRKTNLIITESEFTEDIEHFEGYLDNFKTLTVDVEWLSSCIGQYKIVSFRPYLVTGDDSALNELDYPAVLTESVPFTLTETNIS